MAGGSRVSDAMGTPHPGRRRRPSNVVPAQRCFDSDDRRAHRPGAIQSAWGLVGPFFPKYFEGVLQSPDLTPSGARFEGCGKGHDLFPGCPMNESADTATEKPGRALQKRPFAASGTDKTSFLYWFDRPPK